MIPFLESAGGNCQDATILVEVSLAVEKLVGAWEGTKKRKGKKGKTANSNWFNRFVPQILRT